MKKRGHGLTAAIPAGVGAALISAIATIIAAGIGAGWFG